MGQEQRRRFSLENSRKRDSFVNSLHPLFRILNIVPAGME
jgi:hypothetical protein